MCGRKGGALETEEEEEEEEQEEDKEEEDGRETEAEVRHKKERRKIWTWKMITNSYLSSQYFSLKRPPPPPHTLLLLLLLRLFRRVRVSSLKTITPQWVPKRHEQIQDHPKHAPQHRGLTCRPALHPARQERQRIAKRTVLLILGHLGEVDVHNICRQVVTVSPIIRHCSLADRVRDSLLFLNPAVESRQKV